MNFYQTLSTLRFATRAKTVQQRPIVNCSSSSKQNPASALAGRTQTAANGNSATESEQLYLHL
jgi:hypothetical protein